MRTSGAIGGANPASLARYGTPTPLAYEEISLPQEWAEHWPVDEWRPAGSIAFGASIAAARLDRSPADIFDLFSTARSAPGAVLHVSPTGSDTSGTGSASLPFRSISKAIRAANDTAVPATVMIEGGSYPRWASPGYGGAVPSVDIAFIAHGGRVVTGSWDETGNLPTHAQFTNTYYSANSGVDRVLDRLRLDEDGFYPEYTYVASAAICNRIPGSWAYDNGLLHIHRHDGAPVTTANTYVLRPRAAIWSFSNPVSVYLGVADEHSGFDTIGGNSGAGFWYEATALPEDMNAVVVEKATFRYNGGVATVPSGADGVRMRSLHGLALFSDCDSSNNTRDGFSAGNAVAGASNTLVTVNCRAIRNGDRRSGYNFSQSDNAYTLHDDTMGCDIAGDFRESSGGTVRNVGTTRGLMIGTRIGDDRGDRMVGGIVAPGAVVADEGARIWLDRVHLDMAPAAHPLRAAAGAEIRTRRIAPLRSPAAASGMVAPFVS